MGAASYAASTDAVRITSPIQSYLEDVHRRFAGLDTGQVATYIPELGRADPSWFGVCLAKSTELGWWGDSSVLCERELMRLKPDEFPALHELRGMPEHDALVVVAEPPL